MTTPLSVCLAAVPRGAFSGGAHYGAQALYVVMRTNECVCCGWPAFYVPARRSQQAKVGVCVILFSDLPACGEQIQASYRSKKAPATVCAGRKLGSML